MTVAQDSIAGCRNLVDWTFAGSHHDAQPILFDANDPKRSLTRQQALEHVRSLARAFDPDSTVCLHLPNDPTYTVLVLAILASKCCWTGTNPAYTSHELAHHLRTSNTKYIVTLPDYLEVAEAAVEALDTSVEIIMFSDILSERAESPCVVSKSGEKSFRTLHELVVKGMTESDLNISLNCISLDDTAVLMTTSGTTGLPKMAARTHRALMLELKAIQDNHADKPYTVRRLMCTPMFHAFSTPEMVFNPLRLGYPTYMMRRFDDTFAQKIHDFAITETAAAPPMLAAILTKPATHPLLQSLRLIFCGGAALAAEHRERVLAIFATPPRIVQVWGMTEGGWFTTFKYPEDDATGSVGRPIPGFKIQVSGTGALGLPGGFIAGEILVKSPHLMTGYLGNAAATAQTMAPDGWLRTGDIGYIDDGKVYLVDRIKDLIKVNGWQVAPAELEAALLQAPDVLDAAAIAFGEGIQEHPLLFVIPRSEGLTKEAVMCHLRSKLARFKVSTVEVRFVDSIPRNPSGKILRKILRMWVDDEGKGEVKGLEPLVKEE